MVRYHQNGRVDRAHDNRLEREAHKLAVDAMYDEQIVFARKRNLDASEDKKLVRFVIDKQSHNDGGRDFGDFDVKESKPFPRSGIDRRTLILFSSYANDFFTFESDKDVLHLPVRYPRKHIWGQKKYVQDDQKLLYVRGEEIVEYIVPWLQEMRNSPQNSPMNESPKIGVPEDLLGKIHLYNIMLHLGIVQYYQEPLIEALNIQMTETKLQKCHLDTLEMTVGQFHSRGVPTLDPVLRCFVNGYPFRSPEERAEAEAPRKSIERSQHKVRSKGSTKKSNLPVDAKVEWLNFMSVETSNRKDYPNDTVVVPPKLEVLGHCVRHWSGDRKW